MRRSRLQPLTFCTIGIGSIWEKVCQILLLCLLMLIVIERWWRLVELIKAKARVLRVA